MVGLCGRGWSMGDSRSVYLNRDHFVYIANCDMGATKNFPCFAGKNGDTLFFAILGSHSTPKALNKDNANTEPT